MAIRQNTIILKKSGVPDKVPTFLELGEVAINFADVKMYASGTTAGSILPIGWDRVSKTGDTMSGTLYVPTISATTYQNLPLMSGSFLPLSGGTVSGQTIFISGLTANTFFTDYIDFNTNYTGNTIVEGRMYWDEPNGTVSLGMHGSNVLQQIGLEQYYYIKNQSGSTIENGKVVRAAGTLGSSGRILGEYMIADGSILPKYTLGIATEDIVDGDDGYVTEFGLVRGINTTGSLYGETWNDGDILWVSPTINGGLTKFEPSAPNLKIEIAIVINAASNGSIFVRPNRYPYLNDLQNVNVTGATFGDLLTYDNGYWVKSKTLNGSYSITGDTTSKSVSATTISSTTLTVSGVTFNKLLKEKVGLAAGSGFTGNPKKFTVNFGSNFSNTNYAIILTGPTNRTYTYENQTISGFTINANANGAFTGNVYWIAKQIGEV